MVDSKRDLIEYSGIDSCPMKTKTMFSQINVEKIFCIPAQKPDIEQINKVWAEGCIVDYEIVETPVGESLEGQILTGHKVLVCGEIKLKFQYTANEPKQSVHTAHTSYPFCSYVVLEPNINLSARLYPSVLIEDIFAELIDLRCIYTNITLAVLADVY